MIKRWFSVLLAIGMALLVCQLSLAVDEPTLDPKACTFGDKPLYGKIQIVESFPDIKVQIVESFPDLKVKVVTSFPDACGEWQMVESFPDLKVQFVQSFPDIKVKYVESFPGIP